MLIGYRGTGKSEVARLLADKLEMRLINLDEEIARRAGISIPKIVEKWGWPKFRELEREAVILFSGEDNAVVDTGGGAVLDQRNVADLRRGGRVFWLKAEAGTIVSRIGNSADRPALTEGKSFLDEVAEVLEARLPLYEAAADFEVDTDHAAIAEVAERVLELIEKTEREGGK